MQVEHQREKNESEEEVRKNYDSKEKAVREMIDGELVANMESQNMAEDVDAHLHRHREHG